MRRSKLVAATTSAIVGAVLMTAQVGAQATLGGDWRADVDAFARRVVEGGLAPGMALAVTQDDWVLHSAGFGVADEESGRGVGEESAFYIASSTKALTATAVVLLAARGVLDLEAPVTRYLPDLRLAQPLDADSVTLSDLLSLTHGIEEGGPVVFRTAYSGDFTPELLIHLLSGYGPSKSGRSFVYGNLGYNILGLVLATTGPGGWKEAVEREVLEPLGMDQTSAYLSRLPPERVAMPHEIGPDGAFHRIRLAKADANLHAAGGHFTTAGDLARFLAAHASGGRLEGRQVWPAEAIRRTHALQAEQDRDFGPFHRFGWGFGWDLGSWHSGSEGPEDGSAGAADSEAEQSGLTIVHRFGSFAGYRSHMSFLPGSGLGVVVLVNGDGPASSAADLVATYVYDRLLGTPGVEDLYASRLERLASESGKEAAGYRAALERRRERLVPLAHPLDEYAGTFENAEIGRMEWRVVAGGLEVRIGIARSRAEVYDAAADQLRVELTGGGSVATFEFPSGGGPATSVTVAGYRFVRIAG